MRLRLVKTPEGAESVAVQHDGRWAALSAMPDVAARCDTSDLVSVLGAGADIWAAIAKAAPAAAAEAVDVPDLLPSLPLGLRAFPLWRTELEAVARTGLRRFGPAVAGRLGAAVRDRLGSLLVGDHWMATPIGLRGNHVAVQPADIPVPWPSFTQALDVELGIAAIVAHVVAPGERVIASDVIGGFTLVATAVARDIEHAELHGGWLGPSVSRDIATVMANEAITHHDLPDGRLRGLDTEMLVAGERWATGSTDGAQHSLDDVMTRAAAASGLVPGELIVLTGIPGGSGAAADRWVSPGDLVSFTVEAIGSLTVQIGPPEPHVHAGPLHRAVWTVVERLGHGPDVPEITPQAWTPPPTPELVGPLAPNHRLDGPERLATPGAANPEDVVVGPDGAVYAGVEDGRIYRWPEEEDGVPAEVVGDTHGRPLGLEVSPDGDLIICDADRGLLRLPMEGGQAGDVEVLADRHAGLAMKFTNNAAIADDGTIYFSDSSTRFGIRDYRQDLLEHAPNGRIFAWRPGMGAEPELLLGGLHFPNGVALSPAQDQLLFVQTATYSLHRCWLAGPRAGEQEQLTDQLPGFPDNMCAVGDGSYWIALPSQRLAALDMLLPHPGMRRLTDRLPEAVQPAPGRYSIVVRVDGDGQVLESLHGPAGDYAMVTGMRQHDGWLYLSSIGESGIARVPLDG